MHLMIVSMQDNKCIVLQLAENPIDVFINKPLVLEIVQTGTIYPYKKQMCANSYLNLA